MHHLRVLLRFVSPYRGKAYFSLAMLLAMVALDLAVPRLVQRVIDSGIRRGDLGVVLGTSALMLGISVLSVLVAVLNSNASIRVGEGVARDLREAVFTRIQAFSGANLDRYPTGTLMVRLTSDAQAVQRLVQVSLRIGTRAPLSMIGSIALMFATAPGLAWSLVPLLAVAAIMVAWFSARMEPRFGRVQERLDRLNGILQENISGVRVVKAFVRAGHETGRFESANAQLSEESVGVMRLSSSMGPALTMLINAGMALVIWLGGAKAMDGALTPGQMVAFTNYLLATMHPLVMMTQLANTWANGLASTRRIVDVLDEPAEVPEPSHPADMAVFLAAGRGTPAGGGVPVEFRDADFTYAGETLPAVEKARLRAEPGRVVAVLGATGSGKSSLVNLIPRFYDATGGSVLVGGEDVRNIAEKDLHSLVAIVPQEAILFSGSVRDNIRYGRPTAGEAEVEAAAAAAQAHDFIMRLPGGYQARVEERGVNLSGGQKQRIAIARALLMRPSVLVLDDSTSAVDTETETRLQRAVAEYARGCTVFVVAQRISTALGADLIVVLEEGAIVARGSHTELLATSRVYREIFDSQLGGGVHGAA